jgi:LysM repeat protein
MAERWIDYSGLRPNPADVKHNGATGVLRYLSEPIPATAWKRITVPEKDAILAAGLDLILNFEWYEGRMLEGAAAGTHDGQNALAQARELGYPKGASIYFSHDTGQRNDQAVIAYLRAAQAALGNEYVVDIYSGFDTVEACLSAGVARYGWQTLAWSGGRIGRAHIYQNGNQWYSNGADENEVRARPLGSWLNHGSSPVPVTPAPLPAPASNGKHSYVVVSGDTLGGIAARFNTSVGQLVAWNPFITNPDVIQVGWTLVVGAGPVSVHPAPAPAPAPTPSHKYTVATGDTLTSIALRYHTTVAEMVRLNPQLAQNPNLIQVGWVLNTPGAAAPATPAPRPAPAGPTYTVQQGDSLSSIATRYPNPNITANSIARLNGIANPNLIYPGQILRIG